MADPTEACPHTSEHPFRNRGATTVSASALLIPAGHAQRHVDSHNRKTRLWKGSLCHVHRQ